MDMENRSRCKSSDDTEYTPELRIFGKILFSNFMLPFALLTVDQWGIMLLGIGMNPSAKPARKPHQMRIVKSVIRPHQFTPPSPKSSRRLSQIEIGVEHNPIYTIVCAIQVFLIVVAKLVRHYHLSFPSRRSWVKTTKYRHWAIKSTAPKGPPLPGEVPDEA
jgi:hypothetical protein